VKPVFVTATGTDAGKTFATASLLRALAAEGRAVRALKPLMSGFEPEDLAASDAGRILDAQGLPVTAETVAETCLRSFVQPLAPNVAARAEGVAITHADVLAFVERRLSGFGGCAIVEGAGGIMSPLTDDALNIDLAAQLGGTVVLVANNYLGAVSHTLTACECLARRGLGPAVIVVSQPKAEAPAPLPLIGELSRLLPHVPLAAAPWRDAAHDVALGQRLAGLLWKA
jgi:dethiobiotin synthetase